jgi:hypothetical protein
MRKSTFGFLLVIAVVFSSCGDKTGDVALNFKLEYNGEPLVMFEDVEYPDGKSMFFNRFSFYMSELTIGSHTVDEVKLMNLTADHTSLERAMQGTTYMIEDVELEGGNTTISFNIGVPTDVNATAPADYNSSNDLSILEEYWSPWSSYIFSKTEAKIDADGDGSKEMNVALHLGLNDAFRTVELTTSIDTDGDTVSKDIVIDLYELFDGPNGIYDVIAVPQIHQTNTLDQINELADNMVGAISVR